MQFTSIGGSSYGKWILLLCFISNSILIQSINVWDYSKDRDNFLVPMDFSNYSWISKMNNLNQLIQMTSVPQMIVEGQSVTIYWQGVANATTEDFVGVHCGPTVSLSDLLAKKQVERNVNSKGQLIFSDLYMLRCNYVFTYFQLNHQKKQIIALGQLTVKMKDSFNAPKQGHIALTSIQDEMSVMFNSASTKTPVVRYGVSTKNLNQLSIGTSSTYTAKDMCHAPATTVQQELFRDPGMQHKVVLSKLTPSTRYYYQFGNELDGWSEIYSFMSRPPATSIGTKFIAYGDMGTDPGLAAVTTAKRVLQNVKNGYDGFLLHVGDISYAVGHGHIWDHFFHLIQPIATRIPYMVGIGNHEYDYVSGGEHDPSGALNPGFHPSWGNYGEDSGGECSVPMFHRWSVPENGNSLYWYSFNYGGVHVIQMSTEHDFTRGSKQYQWIENDLSKVDRNVNPWVVLTGHRMMYPTQLGEDEDWKVSLYVQLELEPLLMKYEVNLMLVGHQHSYERSCPIFNRKCVENGNAPVHIIVGSAGAGLEKEGFSPDFGNWSISHYNGFGYLLADVSKETMKLQFILNENGSVYDQVVLRRWKKGIAKGMEKGIAKGIAKGIEIQML